MADNDFDNFEDDLSGDDFGEELASVPKQQGQGQRKPNPGIPRRPISQQQPQQQPQRTVQTQAPASAPVPAQERTRYAPYILPARTGIFDNQTARPLMEDPEKMDLLLAAVTEILNRLDRIEAGL